MGDDSFDVIALKLENLFTQGVRLEKRLEGLEIKMENRLVDKDIFVTYKENTDKRFESHFALIMTIMGLQISMILALIGFLVVAA